MHNYIHTSLCILQDVCPLIYNPEQNAFACDPESIPGGCPLETDAEFQIMWPTSLPNTNVNNTCRSGTGAYTCKLKLYNA